MSNRGVDDGVNYYAFIFSKEMISMRSLMFSMYECYMWCSCGVSIWYNKGVVLGLYMEDIIHEYIKEINGMK